MRRSQMELSLHGGSHAHQAKTLQKEASSDMAATSVSNNTNVSSFTGAPALPFSLC